MKILVKATKIEVYGKLLKEGKVFLHCRSFVDGVEYVFVVYYFEKVGNFKVCAFSKRLYPINQKDFDKKDLILTLEFDDEKEIWEKKHLILYVLTLEKGKIKLKNLKKPIDLVQKPDYIEDNIIVQGKKAKIQFYNDGLDLLVQMEFNHVLNATFLAMFKDFFKLNPKSFIMSIKKYITFDEIIGIGYNFDFISDKFTSTLYSPKSNLEDIESYKSVQYIPENRSSKQVLLSKNLIKYIPIELSATIKIQSFARMIIQKEKYKLIVLCAFRKSNFCLIAKGGTIINKTPYFLLIFQCKPNMFFKCRNLINDTLYYAEVVPSDYVFGFIKTGSFKLVCSALVLKDGKPAFKTKTKSNNSVNLNSETFLIFKKCSEKMSLHRAACKLQAIYRALKSRKQFQLSNPKEIQHFKKDLNGVEYRIALHMKKAFILVESYLLLRLPNGKWLYNLIIPNYEIIEKYGEINSGVILRNLNLIDEKLILGVKSNKETYQMQRHLSFVYNEILMKEQFLLEKDINDFHISIFLRTYDNKFLEGSYEVLAFVGYLKNNPLVYRETSVQVQKASELVGIPSLWVFPIMYYLLNKCFFISESKIGFNFTKKKINLHEFASRIQRKIRLFLTRSKIKKNVVRRRVSVRYRQTFFK